MQIIINNKQKETQKEFKVSANLKLTIFHNERFLYDSINLRNSFCLKKIHKGLIMQEVIKWKQFCHFNYPN